jgi:hypothetical protein
VMCHYVECVFLSGMHEVPALTVCRHEAQDRDRAGYQGVGFEFTANVSAQRGTAR